MRLLITGAGGGLGRALQAVLSGTSHEVHGSVLAGRSTDRAIVARAPLEELWLREGFTPDPDPYRFALAQGDASWHAGRWGLRGDGFGLWRRAGPFETAVDPRWGGRLQAEYQRRLFHGDLGLWVRPGVALVGERITSDGVTLPGFATSTIDVVGTLLGAVITLRARNLEDRVRPQSWIDPTTFLPANGAGRGLRLQLTVQLSN